MSCVIQCLSAAVPLKITQQEEQAASKMETANAIMHQGMPGPVWAVDKTEHVWGQKEQGPSRHMPSISTQAVRPNWARISVNCLIIAMATPYL